MIFESLFSRILYSITGKTILFFKNKFFVQAGFTVRTNKKYIDKSILYSLSPGRSFNKVNEILGEPDFVYQKDCSVNSEDEIELFSNIYLFENALIKVISKNGISIHSFTVLSADENIFPHWKSIFFNDDSSVISFDISQQSIYRQVRARHESYFALSHYVGNPLYMYLTVYGYLDPNAVYSDHSVYACGKGINGFSCSKDEDFFFIYSYEIRGV